MRITMNTKRYLNTSFSVNSVCYMLGANGSGKTSFLEEIAEGFEGKLKKQFLIDGNEVEKNEFAVFHIRNTDTFDMESALGSKSQMKTFVNATLDSLEEEKREYMVKLLSQIGEMLEQEIDDHCVYQPIQSKMVFDLNEFAMKNLVFEVEGTNTKNQSFSKKRKMYIEFILHCIQELHRPYVLLIDDFDMGFSDHNAKEVLWMLQEFSCDEKGLILVTSSRVYGVADLYLYRHQVMDESFLIQEMYQEYANASNSMLEDTMMYVEEEEVRKWVHEKNHYDVWVNSFLSKK